MGIPLGRAPDGETQGRIEQSLIPEFQMSSGGWEDHLEASVIPLAPYPRRLSDTWSFLKWLRITSVTWDVTEGAAGVEKR